MVALETHRFDTDRITASSFRRWLRLGEAGLAVADADGTIAGYVLVITRPNSPIFRVYAIAVDEPFAGRGLGSRLLSWAEDYALERGGREMRLEVQASNEPATRMYDRNGYRVMRALPGYYQDGSDGLRMMKPLSAPERRGKNV